MKKKIIIFGFLALIAATLALGIFYAVESYRFDMDPANGVDILEGLGAVMIMIVTGFLLVYEIDLFYTVYYFFVLPKTKVKSILNICAQLSLVLLYLYARFDCDFLPEELFLDPAPGIRAPALDVRCVLDASLVEGRLINNSLRYPAEAVCFCRGRYIVPGRPVKQYSTKFGKKYASIGQIFHLKKGMECDMITRFKTAETARFLFCEKRLFFMPCIEIY